VGFLMGIHGMGDQGRGGGLVAGYCANGVVMSFVLGYLARRLATRLAVGRPPGGAPATPQS
jgi:hypothetical protein